MHPIVEFQWIDIENLTEFRACRNSIQGALLIVDERGTKSCKNTHIGCNTTELARIPIDVIHDIPTAITCTGKCYDLFAPEISCDITFIPSILKHMQRWWVQ